MSKPTVVKKTKLGTYFKGPGFEFMKCKDGFYSAEMVDGVPERAELIVTPEEARLIIKEHNMEGENSKKLEKLHKQIDALEAEADELENYNFLDQTEQGSEVNHGATTIKVGCNTIPWAMAKKLV